MSAISAMRFRIASRCGPMRGASQTIVTSRCATLPPRLVTRSTANFRNWSDEAPFQRGSFGEKVLADVAVGDRAEDRIDERMQRHVGIGMAGQPAVVRDLHAAEPDVIAVAEGVHVEAVADAQIGEARDAPRLGAWRNPRRW